MTKAAARIDNLVHVRAPDDAELIALGEQFRTAWADERNGYNAPECQGEAQIEAAFARCSDIAKQILERTPVTVDGARVCAMVWGWCHSSQPGLYDGGEPQGATDTRAAHAALTFLLKDCAA